MSDAGDTPREFYLDRVPEQFNRSLRQQERVVESAQRLLEEMQSVTATIRVEVRGPDGGTFYLNVEAGRMSGSDTPLQPPFLTLVQDRDAFARLARAAGDSALGLLGGLSGLAGEMKLTRSRLENLAGVKGCMHFEVTGPDGFSLLTHFGADPIPEAPNTTIRVDGATYGQLLGGSLDPQNAFMSGKIEVEGDMQLAMQLALAALSPD